MADFDKAFGKTGAGNEEEMNRKKDLKELTQTVRLKSGCKAKFDKNPSAFLAEVAETAEGKCPISGRDAGKEASSTITVAVCCTGCLGKVENNPKPYLTKLARTLKKGKGGS